MPLLNYLSTVLPPDEIWRLTIVGGMVAILVFLLAEYVVRMTIVYRRNNEAVLYALAIAASGFFALGYVGLLAFVAGTLTGGWFWASGIEASNARAHRARIEKNGRSPERGANEYRHPDNHHAVSGT